MIIAGLIMLAAVALPMIDRPRRCGGPRITCANNLHQIAVAAKTWALDNQDHYPYQVSGTNGGAREDALLRICARRFSEAMSNELNSTIAPHLSRGRKSLLCPKLRPQSPQLKSELLRQSRRHRRQSTNVLRRGPKLLQTKWCSACVASAMHTMVPTSRPLAGPRNCTTELATFCSWMAACRSGRRSTTKRRGDRDEHQPD